MVYLSSHFISIQQKVVEKLFIFNKRQVTTVIFVIALLLDPHVEVRPHPAVNARSLTRLQQRVWFDSILFSSLLFPDSFNKILSMTLCLLQ